MSTNNTGARTTDHARAAAIRKADGRQAETQLQCMQVWGGSGHADTSVSTTGLDVWLFSKPFGNHEAGGDIYYLSSCSSGRITRLAVADVCGHGETVAAMARTLRDVMQRHINHINQRTLVRSVNHEFAAQGDASTFATGLIGTYFLPTGTLSLTNAGHPPPLFFSAERRDWRSMEDSAVLGALQNVPLGMFDGADYTQIQIRLSPGDLLLSFTDGLEESVDKEGRVLGREGLIALLTSLGPMDPAQIIPAITTKLASMSASNLADDDMTVMLIRPNGATVPLRDNLLAPFRYLASAMGWRQWSQPPPPPRIGN